MSPFHDVPLFANADKTVLNMIVEIPRWSNAKLEVSPRYFPSFLFSPPFLMKIKFHARGKSRHSFSPQIQKSKMMNKILTGCVLVDFQGRGVQPY